ncbi:hypothetical protein K439DRAFT_1387642, partial [Ramaria rubella]
TCLDNASNNDTFCKELAQFIPSFHGTAVRGRCFPHTVNLIAKVFTLFFFKAPPRNKKTVKVAGTKRKHAPATEQEDITLVLQEGERCGDDNDVELLVETAEDAEAISGLDEGQIAQDDAIVQ